MRNLISVKWEKERLQDEDNIIEMIGEYNKHIDFLHIVINILSFYVHIM